MCANYTPPSPEGIKAAFGIGCHGDYPEETFPGYQAPILRIADEGSKQLECVTACFGMQPPWAERTLSRHTYNARSETVADKPSFRHAWRKRQWCIVPADAFYEPSYASGTAVRWKIAQADRSVLGIAGLWEWRPNGGVNDQPLLSFTMLTINASSHPLMQQFHRPNDEKRMPVLLRPSQYQEWLHATEDTVNALLRPYPTEKLAAEPAPRVTKATAKKMGLPLAAQVSKKPELRSLWDEG